MLCGQGWQGGGLGKGGHCYYMSCCDTCENAHFKLRKNHIIKSHQENWKIENRWIIGKRQIINKQGTFNKQGNKSQTQWQSINNKYFLSHKTC